MGVPRESTLIRRCEPHLRNMLLKGIDFKDTLTPCTHLSISIHSETPIPVNATLPGKRGDGWGYIAFWGITEKRRDGKNHG